MVGYYGLPFVMSLYLQQLRGLSALGAGVTFVPMMLIGGLLTPFTARLAERFGARVLVTTGLICMTAGLVVISLVPANTSRQIGGAPSYLDGAYRTKYARYGGTYIEPMTRWHRRRYPPFCYPSPLRGH